MHVLGHPSLNAREQIRVEAELDQVARLGAAGELRVEHLVAVVAEGRGRHWNAFEEVRKTPPIAVGKCGLVDHLGAGAHRGLGLLKRLALACRVLEHRRHDDHIESLLNQRVEEGALVLITLAGNQIGGVGPGRLDRLDPACDAQIERR